MIEDFLRDFCEACEREGVNYLVIVRDPRGNGARIMSELEGWQPVTNTTIKADILQLLDVALGDNG